MRINEILGGKLNDRTEDMLGLFLSERLSDLRHGNADDKKNDWEEKLEAVIPDSTPLDREKLEEIVGDVAISCGMDAEDCYLYGLRDGMCLMSWINSFIQSDSKE